MLRPLDLQDNFSKAPLAAREQNIQQIRGEVTQHNMAQQMDQEHVLDHSRIRESGEADGAETRVDDHDRQPGEQKRQRRQQHPGHACLSGGRRAERALGRRAELRPRLWS